MKEARKSIYLVTSYIHKCLEGICLDPDFEAVEEIVEEACDSMTSEVDHRAQRQFTITLFSCKKVNVCFITLKVIY